jgi:acetyl/propionyl-CoA carboxylase alpha subunit
VRAQSEAERSFGSSDCILEKYIESAKHIEIQIMGDSHGKVIALWERECSVQRRHQKVIEESPSPFLSQMQRERMCSVAVKLGELISYEGAGTVEFVVDAKDGSFYFIEVNTRLQVEHPITEEVTGFDLVALQLFVAAGGKLSDVPQLQRVPQHGHAIECRLCAEDTANNFAPVNGTIRLWREADFARGLRDVRYESAVRSGSNISIFFDSMIAKVVVWAPTRDLAIAKMVKVMANTACIGLKTSQLFLQSCLLHPSFKLPTYTTSLIPDNLTTLLKNPYISANSPEAGALVTVPTLLLRQSRMATHPQLFGGMRTAFQNQSWSSINVRAQVVRAISAGESPELLLCVWKAKPAGKQSPEIISVEPLAEPVTNHEEGPEAAGLSATHAYTAVSQQLRRLEAQQGTGNTYSLTLRSLQPLIENDSNTALLEVAVNGSIVRAWCSYSAGSSLYRSAQGGYQSITCHFPALGTWIEYQCFSLLSYFEVLRNSKAKAASGTSSKLIHAPMPCKVLSVVLKDGEKARKGQTVLAIESMKMETSISSSVDGVFHTTLRKGDAVEEGSLLCWFD